MSHGFFVSDLHLFSRRSQAARHVEALHATARKAKTFVLGGDIFDFRWTTLKSVAATVDAATDWLAELATQHPGCEFHFVLGNHDYHEQFLQPLAELCDAVPNLTSHDYYLRLGHCLFLHGDIADKPMTPETLHARRGRGLQHAKKGRASNLLYDLVVKARIHKVAATLKHGKRQVAERIFNYAEQIGHGPDSGVQHVYFGHTHRAMSNYEFGGLRFHNGGAPMKGLKFRIVETEVG